MDGITAVEMITRDVPIAQVIMMSVQSEADYLRRSMLAGARDFLTKPFTSDELVSTIRRVHRMGQTGRRRWQPPHRRPLNRKLEKLAPLACFPVKKAR
jgi:pilus assembly protein CpaE